MSFRRSPLIHLALMFFLGLLVYSNTLTVPFIFDDIPNINLNPYIERLSNIPSLFAGGTGPFASRPLMHATFALNYHLGGIDPTGYHAVNLALHLINGALLYFLVVMTGRLLKYNDESARPAALLASLIFVVHPVQTEAVTYVVSRSMLLATTFYLSGILLFAKAATAERRKWLYIASLFIVSLLGAASREDFITFPLMLLLYDLFFISGFRAREAFGRWRLYIAVLPACAYLIYLALNNTYDLRANYSTIAIPPLHYALTQLNVHWTYLRLLLLPINQNIDYGYPIAKTLFELPTLFSFLGYLGLWAGAVLLARRTHPLAFAMMWFLVALLPISFMLVPVGTALDLKLADVLFEHRLYLPSAGLIMGAVASVAHLSRTPQAKRVLVSLFVAFVVVLGSAAHARNALWTDGARLWEDAVKKSGKKARIYNNLGLEYLLAGLTDKAIEHLTMALELDPKHAKTYYNLGNAYMKKGLIDKAVENYQAAIYFSPSYAYAYSSLAHAYWEKGLVEEAIKNYQTAIRIDPRHASDYNNLGVAYLQKGLIEEAIETYQAAIRIAPRHANAYFNLGLAYMYKGDIDNAIENYTHYLDLEPGNPDAHENLGSAYLRKGMTEEARMQFGIAESLRQGKRGPGANGP